jgi:hypothetical protein
MVAAMGTAAWPSEVTPVPRKDRDRQIEWFLAATIDRTCGYNNARIRPGDNVKRFACHPT